MWQHTATMPLQPGTTLGPYEAGGGHASPDAILIHNWFDELQRLVPTP